MAVRMCGAAVFILQTTLYMAVVLYAPALALEAGRIAMDIGKYMYIREGGRSIGVV